MFSAEITSFQLFRVNSWHHINPDGISLGLHRESVWRFKDDIFRYSCRFSRWKYYVIVSYYWLKISSGSLLVGKLILFIEWNQKLSFLSYLSKIAHGNVTFGWKVKKIFPMSEIAIIYLIKLCNIFPQKLGEIVWGSFM